MYTTELGKILTFQRGFDLPTSKRFAGEYPIISSSGFTGNHNEYKCDGENVVTGRYGTIGEVYYYDGKCWPLNTSLFVKDFKSNNARYIYYLLKHVLKIDGKDKSTVPGVDRNVLHTMKVPFIQDVEEQKRVSSILESIDDKITINNKINDNLEQQTKLLFDYWFTQFDFPDENGNPYRSSGGRMVWNDELKCEIPEGWQVAPISDFLMKNTTVFDYSKVLPTIDLSVMPSDSIALNQLNESSNFTTNLYEMDCGDILFGSIRPYLHKAGIAPCDGVVAGTIHSYKVKDEKFYNFVLATMTRKIFFDFALNVSTGSKMPVVSSEALLSYKVAYSHELAEKFSVISLKDTIIRNVQENQELVRLRDQLLPMLMNGQVSVVDKPLNYLLKS
ncbi:restriction endonuclease subunit S [Bacillus pretiosus]|uniref:restriction endonuclease subunit S n=1 Tax=Bacillus pretiosus TaxID=2983392 RepID=UPI003D648FCE